MLYLCIGNHRDASLINPMGLIILIPANKLALCAGSQAPALIVIHKCWGVRLFGMDAEIQRPRMANCGTQQMPLNPRTGNYGLATRLNQALALSDGYRPWPGFRHPCRKDGPPTLVSNDGGAGAWQRAKTEKSRAKPEIREEPEHRDYNGDNTIRNPPPLPR